MTSGWSKENSVTNNNGRRDNNDNGHKKAQFTRTMMETTEQNQQEATQGTENQAVTQTGEGTNNPTQQTSEEKPETPTHSPPQRQSMTYLRTKDRLQALFRSWKHHERHEDGRIKAPLSFTIPLLPNPFNLLRDATPSSPDWDVPSSPWTHHLLQYQKTNLRMGYKRMTRAKVKLMQAIRRDHKLPPISLGGEQQQVTTRLKITDKEAHSTSTIQKARQKMESI
jgi:hypothetical protein